MKKLIIIAAFLASLLLAGCKSGSGGGGYVAQLTGQTGTSIIATAPPQVG